MQAVFTVKLVGQSFVSSLQFKMSLPLDTLVTSIDFSKLLSVRHLWRGNGGNEHTTLQAYRLLL